MIYYVLRFYARLGLWINFRKIYFEYADRLPARPTVVYGLNHPTAFLEPIILGTHVSAPCWYMLRSDKFRPGFVAWFLHQIRNLPIGRAADRDRAALRRNIETLSFAAERVTHGEPTIILSEGAWSGRRRLKAIQRGTARLLFQASKKDRSAPVAIVPVAVNYTAPNRFRSEVVMSYGEPLYAADFAERFREDARATVDAVTAELEDRLRGLVIHVEDAARESLAERLLPLVRNDYPDSGAPPVGGESHFRAAQWAAVEALNAMDDVAARSFAGELDRYEQALQRAGLTDAGLANPQYGSLGRAFTLWLTGIVAMVGFLLNYPVAAFVERQTTKRVRSPQFLSSVRYGLGLGAYLAYVAVATAVAAVLVRWFALVLPIALPLWGYGFLVWFESFKLWRESARVKSVADDELSRLREMREGILGEVGLRARGR